MKKPTPIPTFNKADAASRYRQEMTVWLSKWTYHRYVTLTFNQPYAGDRTAIGSSLKHGHLKRTLRSWDARVNRAILGRHWSAMDADRTWSFFTLEKPGSNPHFHGLVRFFTNDEDEISRQAKIFDNNIERIWKELVPSGSIDLQDISDRAGVTKYIAKTINCDINADNFFPFD